MSRTWLLLDVNNLCWRAFHTTGKLSYGGFGTGTTFGFLTTLRNLMDTHATRHVVFAFDCGRSHRERNHTFYKETRRKQELLLPEKDREARLECRKQINLLRDKRLTKLGCKNVFFEDGYEADDIIASIVHNLPKRDEAIIVSSDKDLYQLLSKRVCIWDPLKKEVYTKRCFRKEWKLLPKDWINIKAIAGCKTDDIPKLMKGVAEKTAAAYLRGEHPKGSTLSKAISKHMQVYQLNKSLVRLPYEGCPTFELDTNSWIDPQAWKEFARKLGMSSLVDRAPRQLQGFGFKPRKIEKDDDETEETP